jgi:hypothetical protein
VTDAETSIAAPLTCSVCARSSTWHAAFTEVRDGTIKRLCCPRCAATLHGKGNRWRLAFFVIAVALSIFVLFKTRVRGLDLLIVLWVLVALVQIPLVVLHEAGHAFTAWLVGTPAFAIIIGREPWILDRQIFGIRWRIGRHVSGGLTYHAPSKGRHALARDALITAAGPLTNLIIAVAALAAAANLPGRLEHSLARLALLMTGIVSAMQFMWNVWPREVQTIAGKIPNDGARIRNLLKGQRDDLRKSSGARHYFRAVFAFADRDFETAAREAAKARARMTDPASIVVISVLGAAARSESDDARGAVELLRPLQNAPHDNPGVRAGVADNLGWAYLLLDEPELLESGILLVAEACAIAPWEESFVISLACLFAASSTAENDRLNDARNLLSTVRLRKLTRQNAAYAALAQGLCAAAAGDAVVARELYNDAKSRGATVAPLRLLERRLASH